MRMMPSRALSGGKPALVKKERAKLAHISPPVKGLAQQSKSNIVDAQTAAVLTNFYVDDDRISARAGYRKIATLTGPPVPAVEHLIPHYGAPARLLAASMDTLFDAEDGSVLKSGFTSGNWHWSAFANLGAEKYTVLCNGSDGVWSWDGGNVAPGSPVTVTKIEALDPARVTVSSLAGFADGQTVIIAGADVAHGAANGPQVIFNVGTVANTFELVDVNLTGSGGDQTTGAMTATTQGSFERCAIHAPPGATFIDPDEFHIVVAHMNRLWFADETNLAVYFLPLQQKSGELTAIPLNALFKRGGTIKAMATWTVDSGVGMDDCLVIFTTNGECAIYSGVDPDTDMGLVGIYRFDPPMSKHCVINYGGDLWVLLPTGCTPMTAMIKAGKEGLDAVDRNVVTMFLHAAIAYRENPGWQLFLNPSSGRLFANQPQGGGVYSQMVRHMPKPVWSRFEDIPARSWAWIEPFVYFASDKGDIYEMHPLHQNDDGKPIRVDVQMAWSQFKTPAQKHFKMILPYIVTNGAPRPFVDIKVDYDESPAKNRPELTTVGAIGSKWDVSLWDVSYWAGGTRAWSNWTGVGALGRVGAVRLSGLIADCNFAITGWDVLYEPGSVFG